MRISAVRIAIAPLILLLLFTASAFVRADPSQGFGPTCARDDYGPTNNDGVYQSITTSNLGANVGLKIYGLTDWKLANGSNGYTLNVDFRVSVTSTFTKHESSDSQGICKASTYGAFATTSLLWMDYSNVSQGGILQNTVGEALGIASPSGDAQLYQSVNSTAPTGLSGECCQVNDQTITHQYIFTRIVDSSNPSIGYKIVDIHFFRVYGTADHKYKMWADVVVDTSQTYNATIPSGAIVGGTHTYSGVQQERWKMYDGNNGGQLNIRAEDYGGTYDDGFPVIGQSACSC